MHRIHIHLAALALVWSSTAAAVDFVAPSELVRSSVTVREGPSSARSRVGQLRRGEQAELVSSAEGWHELELEDGTRGYASAAWTVVIPGPGPEEMVVEVPPPAPPLVPQHIPEKRSAFARFLDSIAAAFRGPATVDFRIKKPALEGEVYQHWDPTLAISGLATLMGSSGIYEIILVIDASTSTSEFAFTDVDADGVLEPEWRSDDSIFHAEISAGHRFLEALRRLPSNENGKRIRVGVVTFSGDEDLHRRPEDEDFEPTSSAIVALAQRDADLRIPLTHDYAAVDRALEELGTLEPRGMTNVAAGVGRALIELRGMEKYGAQSEPRLDAERIVHFLTDGTPSLPFDAPEAERAAEQAARMAASSDVRVNVFQIGVNIVTLKTNPAMENLARWSGGKFTLLENARELGTLLEATSLSYVDRVKLVNETTNDESDYIATGIDGSFYGEVQLQEGVNEIAVFARTPGKRSAVKTFEVEYRYGPPKEELQARLVDLRRENEVLIEEIKKRLAMRMERERQNKNLDVGAELVE